MVEDVPQQEHLMEIGDSLLTLQMFIFGPISYKFTVKFTSEFREILKNLEES